MAAYLNQNIFELVRSKQDSHKSVRKL